MSLPELAGARQLEADLRHLIDLLARDEQSPRIIGAAVVASGIASRFEVTWNRGDIRLATADERAEVGARLKLAGLVKDSDGAYVPGRKSAREVLRGKPADELLRDGTR